METQRFILAVGMVLLLIAAGWLAFAQLQPERHINPLIAQAILNHPQFGAENAVAVLERVRAAMPAAAQLKLDKAIEDVYRAGAKQIYRAQRILAASQESQIDAAAVIVDASGKAVAP